MLLKQQLVQVKATISAKTTKNFSCMDVLQYGPLTRRAVDQVS